MVRLLKIVWACIRYRLDDIVDKERLSGRVRFCLYLLPWRYVIHTKKPRGVRIRQCMEYLGPVFIKFGQMLSTRCDLLPEDISDELAKLRDQVPSFSTQEAIRIIERSYNKPILEVFSWFDEKPLASASVAQVHAAYTKDGKEVVLKVIRPGIKKIILSDIRLLFFFVRVFTCLLPWTRRLKAVEVVSDYKNTILDELDLIREAANGSQLRRNFSDGRLLYIPKVYWTLSNAQVLVMERIYGVSVSDITQLQGLGIDMKKLAERGVEIFFTQVFRDRFFHADMHPGNIFVDVSNPEDPRYLGVDFGIMGTLEQEDQRYLAGNLLAFFRRDYRKVAQLHIDSGWVVRGTKVGELETAIRSVCEPIFEKPLKEISFASLLIRLFQTASRFDMTVQPQLVLLEKTLLHVEGLGRQIYPDLDLWSTARPFLEQWMKNQLSPMRMVKQLRNSGAEWLLSAPPSGHNVLTGLRALMEQKNNNDELTEKLKYKERMLKINGGLLLSVGVFLIWMNSAVTVGALNLWAGFLLAGFAIILLI